jgi:4-hydroxy-2-oxoheptanedioate aldolase
MPMRINALKRKLAEGTRPRGFILEFNNPELVEMLGHLGFDFAYIDGQHGGLTVETARALIRAADCSGMTSIVRVPRNDASVILEYLDAGAGGIVVPNVTTRAEVDAATDAVRYPPKGKRGGFARSRAATYGIPQTAAEYFARMNDEIMLLPLLEDVAALDNLDAICSAPGVDAIAVGPSDLALSMGIVGGWSEEPVQANVERIRAAAAAAGKPIVGVALNEEDGRRLLARGFDAIQVSVAGTMARAFGAFLEATAV